MRDITLFRNVSGVQDGTVFDLYGMFVEHMQITYSTYSMSGASITLFVEWSNYDSSIGPWETIYQVTTTSDEHVTVRDPNGVTPGFLRWVRARISASTGYGVASVFMYVG